MGHIVPIFFKQMYWFIVSFLQFCILLSCLVPYFVMYKVYYVVLLSMLFVREKSFIHSECLYIFEKGIDAWKVC